MSAIVSCHAESQINAPASIVYNLLTDTSTWPEWNTFIQRVVVESPKPSTQDANSSRMQLGQDLRFHVFFPISGKRRNLPGGSLERITHVDPHPRATPSSTGSYQVCWDQVGIPQFLLHTHRVNLVESDRTNENVCKYTSYMTFNGPFAWFIKFFGAKMLQAEFDEWAVNLKNAAERKYAEPSRN